MGSGYRGDFGYTQGFKTIHQKQYNMHNKSGNSIYSNAINVSHLFDFKNGLFGTKNRKPRSKPREIIVSNPQTSASVFFNTLSAGGKKEIFNTGYGKGIKATLSDKSVITYRPTTSSDGSPAVEIVVSGSKNVKPKKYHIVKKGDK